MEYYCSKCGTKTNFSGDLHCRQILIIEIKKLLLQGEDRKAKELVLHSQGNKSWDNWKEETFKKFYYEFKRSTEKFEFEENERLEKERKLKNIEILTPAILLLNENKLFEADHFVFLKQSDDLLIEYEKIKFEFIQNDLRHLETRLNKESGYFDDEKAKVLSTTNKNILVQARAGSGKTTAIALKVRQLINSYGVKPDEFLVLAFNNTAAGEFRNRIKEYCGDGIATKSNTLTFHALARRIANTKKQILESNEVSGDENSRNHGKDNKLQIDFIRDCFNSVEEKERGFIEKLFYSFLKTTSEKSKESFKNRENDYYLYLRNLQYTTIAGEIVKSKGEKYIADFLFEHTIHNKEGKELEYSYERNIKEVIGSSRPYCPDFSLFTADDKKKEQLCVVIEYFGFTNKNTGYPGFFENIKESQDYLKKSAWARKLFIDKKVNFIEMSVDDFHKIKLNNNNEESIRSEFEKVIHKKLVSYGFIVSKKLSLKEILAKIPKVERRKKKLVQQIAQFINKAQKLSYGPDKIRKIAGVEKNKNNLSFRNEFFIKIAIRVYSEYKSRLEEENYTDFDGFFIDAINKVKDYGDECEIKSEGGDIKIKNIKYILIDEYQDFSELFYGMIDSIRNINESISFFCVGDDWQAINGFAGSDLKYFENFEKEYFKDGRRVSLLTNYRSYSNIVKNSNLLMSGYGPGGESGKNKPDGSVNLYSLLWVELRNSLEYLDEFNLDEKYRSVSRQLVGLQDKDKKTPLEIGSYLKTVEDIVCKTKNKKICLLFRSNKLYGVEILKFTDQIRKWRFPENPSKWDIEYEFDKEGKINTKKPTGYINGIICSTTHSFKGKESDVVIVVDANKRSYPKLHPDNELMELLGVTMFKILEEERRLFYVAITRAKEELYLLYEEEKGHSDFISNSMKKEIPEDLRLIKAIDKPVQQSNI